MQEQSITATQEHLLREIQVAALVHIKEEAEHLPMMGARGQRSALGSQQELVCC